MNRRRFGVYLLVMLALFGAGLIGPRAWATSSQARPGQEISVPTRTPVTQWSPSPPATSRPTSPPTGRPPANATATPLPSGPTAAPPAAASTPTVPEAAGAGAALALVKEADHLQVWPGTVVKFTLTLTNPGVASARQIVLEDALPAGLAPGTIEGTSAAWDGRTLRASLPLLPPGGRWVVVFSAIVEENRGAGELLVNSAQATALGGLNARADAYLALPPAELPAVGGNTSHRRQLP